MRFHALPESLLVAILLAATPANAIWPFKPKRFRGNSLIQAGSMGVDANSRIVAFGDFNGDQYLDVIAIGEDQQTLTVYLWHHNEFQYRNSATLRHPRKVHNVVPGDFTQSGRLGLLIMSEADSGKLNLDVYPPLGQGTFDPSPVSIPSSSDVQPMVVDMDGDLKIDLLGQTAKNGPLQFWQNVWDAASPNPTLFEIKEPNLRGKQCTLANPHSNALIDLDGDCLADLFLVCDEGRGARSYQIWVNAKTNGFTLAQEGALPTGIQAVSFADMDRDGTIDMVFATCGSVSTSTGLGKDCFINIAYNKQLPLCSKNEQKASCRQPDNLCLADPNFQFDLNDSPDNPYFKRIPLSSLVSTPNPKLLVMDTTHSPPIPVPLQLGDANLDGFPDILTIIDHTPRLVLSGPCHGQNGCKRRDYQVITKGTEILSNIKDARGTAWLDMDEDGTLDILVQRTGGDGQGTVLFIQNNFYYDAFFLKAIVLNGACNSGLCTDSNGTKFDPFGVSYSGASYKYTVIDTTGQRSAAQVGQLPQTSYHSLLTPYAFFGLGRTNNYIENLFAGATLHAPLHYISLEGVVPNSKLVLRPNDEGWRIELFLRPGEWVPWVLLTVIIGMAVLAMVVFGLHLTEKREDELERRKISHHINFDAL